MFADTKEMLGLAPSGAADGPKEKKAKSNPRKIKRCMQRVGRLQWRRLTDDVLCCDVW
jgi:hypothetical protein